MLRLLKVSSLILLSLIALVVVGLLVLTQVIDPNDFKPQIQQLAREEANIELDIQGDLAWTFWPSLGISIGKTEARLGDESELFAGIEQANTSVAVWPLLFGNVQVDGILVDGLTLHLVQTADGANWEKFATGEPAGTEAVEPVADEAPLDIPVMIPEVVIKNATVTYDDDTTDTHIILNNINVSAQDVNLKDAATPFPLSASLRFQDPDTRIDLNLDAQVSLDLAAERYRLAPMMLHAVIAGVTPEPITVHLTQSVDADMAKGVVALTDMALTAAGVETSGQVSISGLTDDQLVFAGTLSVAGFNANQVLQALGEMPIETSDSAALSRISAELTLNGPANSVMADPLVIRLDDSTIKGKAGLASLDTGKLVFDLVMDHIVLDGYLPPMEEAAQDKAGGVLAGGDAAVSQAADQPLSTEPLFLPEDIQLLRDLLLDGKFVLGEMQFDKVASQNLALTVTAQQGKINVSTQGGLLEGNHSLTALLNVSGAQPVMSAKGQVVKAQMRPVVEMVLDEGLLSGLISSRFEGSAQGNSEKSLMESAAATFDLQLSDAVLHGVSLHRSLEAGLAKHKDLLALARGDRELPRELREDTNIAGLTADGSLENQVARINNIQSEMSEGTVAGKGWLNINNDDFEFILTMRSPLFGGSPYLEGTDWPIRCAGNLDGNPARWCGPDSKGLGNIANQALTNAAKKKLVEKLGIESDADNVKDLAEDAVKQKLQEEQKKAEDDLKEKARDKLKELFK